jgi:hypothetical protein
VSGQSVINFLKRPRPDASASHAGRAASHRPPRVPAVDASDAPRCRWSSNQCIRLVQRHGQSLQMPASGRITVPGRLCDCGGRQTRSILRYDRDAPLSDRLDERAVVAKVLIGVFDRKLADRVVEGRVGSQVASDPGRIAGPRMGARQRPAAKLAPLAQRRGVPVLNDPGELRVPKLPELIVTPVFPASPAEEDVARRLHEPLPGDHLGALLSKPEMRSCAAVPWPNARRSALGAHSFRM